jgi:hypothetical protein
LVYPIDRHLHEIPPGFNRLIALDAVTTESPFARGSRCDRRSARDFHPCHQALPRLSRSYGLMRPTSILSRLCITLFKMVFAGCCVPLLEGGRSRRYLRESFPRCLDPYPGGPCGARARYFPLGVGLPPFLTRSALHNIRTTTSVRSLVFEAAVIHSCSGPRVCSPPRSFPPGQLTTGDFHPIKIAALSAAPFAFARLSDSQLILSGETFSSTLTTMALYQCSLRCFGACSCKPTPRDLPSSLAQLHTLYIKVRSWRTASNISVQFVRVKKL